MQRFILWNEDLVRMGTSENLQLESCKFRVEYFMLFKWCLLDLDKGKKFELSEAIALSRKENGPYPAHHGEDGGIAGCDTKPSLLREHDVAERTRLKSCTVLQLPRAPSLEGTPSK